MATTVATLEAVLRADTRKFIHDIDKADSKMGGFKKAAIAGAVGAGAGIAYGLGKVAKIGWDEFNEGQKVAAQTNAVLKSTGSVANVTAKDVENLGVSLMKKSGVDDEVIKSGENMLLTFTNIRNELGRGNDIFDQATKLTLDMSVAMGKDMNSSAIMVGKALNDPIAGLTSLSRVGVKFTEETKEQIKTLVENGETMKAQKIILAELRTEFGGSAAAAGKTFGGQINILRERFNNWAGDMVAKAIPMLQRFATWLNKHVIPAAKEIAAVIRKNWPSIQESLQVIWKRVEALSPVFRLWLKVGTFVVKAYVQLFARYVQGIAKVIEITDRFVEFMRGPVSSVIEFVRDKFALLRNTAKFTWDFVRDRAQVVIDKVQAIIQKLQDFVAYVRSIPGKIKDALGAVGGFFAGVGGAIVPGKDIHIMDFMGAPNPTIDRRLWGALGLANAMGLTLSSGYRPGATIRGSGSRSDHSYFPSKAIDISGPAASMRAYAQAVTRIAGVQNVIHTPVDGGIWSAGAGWHQLVSAITRADHYDHVHVDTFDRGGWLRPGWTLAGNFTGRPERVGGGDPQVINLHLDGRRFAQWMVDLDGRQRRNGGQGLLG